MSDDPKVTHADKLMLAYQREIDEANALAPARLPLPRLQRSDVGKRAWPAPKWAGEPKGGFSRWLARRHGAPVATVAPDPGALDDDLLFQDGTVLSNWRLGILEAAWRMANGARFYVASDERGRRYVRWEMPRGQPTDQEPTPAHIMAAERLWQ